MKFIYPDNIIAIEMTDENSNFPAEYALTEYIKQKAKSTENTSTITITCTGAKAVFISGTNATSVRVLISQGVNIEWEAGKTWESGIEWEQSLFYQSFGTHDPSEYDFRLDGNGKAWIEYDREGVHDLTLEFAAPVGQVLEVGKIYAGPIITFPAPLLGLKYKPIDYSFLQELNMPGAFNVVDQDQVGSWRFGIAASYEDNFWTFYDSLIAKTKYHPLPGQLKNNDGHFLGYMRIKPGTMPDTTFGEMPTHGRINMELLEVV